MSYILICKNGEFMAYHLSFREDDEIGMTFVWQK